MQQYNRKFAAFSSGFFLKVGRNEFTFLGLRAAAVARGGWSDIRLGGGICLGGGLRSGAGVCFRGEVFDGRVV